MTTEQIKENIKAYQKKQGKTIEGAIFERDWEGNDSSFAIGIRNIALSLFTDRNREIKNIIIFKCTSKKLTLESWK